MIKVGVDLDNTIINYDGVFHEAALELEWITPDIAKDKESVKAFFITQGREPKWTELQGVVYGKCLNKAAPYADAYDCLNELTRAEYELHLISHKTRYPIIGERWDFHDAANTWLSKNLFSNLFSTINFCETKRLKIETINQLDLDIFIDDLPSILTDQRFSPLTKKVLFDPNEVHVGAFSLFRFSNWQSIQKWIFEH